MTHSAFTPSSLSSFGSPALFADFSITSTGPAFVNMPYANEPDIMLGSTDGTVEGLEAAPVDTSTSGWTLDDLLGATLPDFDMSQYTNGDLPTLAAPEVSSGRDSDILEGDANGGLGTPFAADRSADVPISNPCQIFHPAPVTSVSLPALSIPCANQGMKIGPLLETFCA